MFLHVDEVSVIGRLTLALLFNNGERRVVDLSGSLEGEVFAPLRNQRSFAAVYVNPETGTIEWPNGADFAPEYLYEIGLPSDAPAAVEATA